MNDLPNISVIVPVWNGAETVSATIKALLDQTYPAERVQIIVVDNGSSDSTREVIREHKMVILLQEEKPGSYAARNCGLARSTGSVVAFTDADCAPDKSWLTNAVSCLRTDPQIGVVAGKVEVVPSAEGSRIAYLIERELAFRQEENAKRGTSVTANWISWRDIVARAGGFDEQVKSGGDWILSTKITSQGLKVAYSADAVVYHPSRGTVSDIFRKRRRVTGGVWARRKGGLFRILKAELAGGVQRSLELSRSKQLSFSEKLRTVPIAVAMTGVSIAELFRLVVGGTPRRS